MSLNGQAPLRMGEDKVGDFRIDFISFAPLALQVEEAVFGNFFGLL